MSRLLQRPSLECNVSLQLNEQEIRALDALAGYGIDGFLSVFYKHMGESYLRPHEAGLRSLFEVVRTELPSIMRRATAARTAFTLQNPVIRSRKEHDELIAHLIERATPYGIAEGKSDA